LIRERFGPFRFEIALRVEDGGLHYPVRRGTILGLPLPRALLPRSDTVESARDDRASFDVAISLPGIGDIVRYRECLRSVGEGSADMAELSRAGPRPPTLNRGGMHGQQQDSKPENPVSHEPEPDLTSGALTLSGPS